MIKQNISLVTSTAVNNEIKSHSNIIYVDSLDYDGCTDILFYETYRDQWIWHLAKKIKDMVTDDLKKEIEQLIKEYKEDWSKMEPILAENKEFQKVKQKMKIEVLAPLAKTFMEQLEKKEMGPGKKIVVIGSNRQTIFIDQINRAKGNGSCFINYHKFDEKEGWEFFKWVCEDIIRNKKPEETVKSFYEYKNDASKHFHQVGLENSFLSKRLEAVLPEYEFGVVWGDAWTKSIFLIEQMKLIKERYPNNIIYFRFVDDRGDIVQGVEKFFNKYPHLIPQNLHFTVSQSYYYQEDVGFLKNLEFKVITTSPIVNPKSPPEQKLKLDNSSPPKQLNEEKESKSSEPLQKFHLNISACQVIYHTQRRRLNLSDAKFLEGQGTVNRINLFLQRDPANGELNDFIQFDKAQTELFNNDGFSIWTTATQFKKIKETYLDPQEKNLQDLQELSKLIEPMEKVSNSPAAPLTLFGTLPDAKAKAQKEITLLKYDLQNCCTQVSSQAALEEFMKLVKTKSSQAPILVKLLQDLKKTGEELTLKLNKNTSPIVNPKSPPEQKLKLDNTAPKQLNEKKESKSSEPLQKFHLNISACQVIYHTQRRRLNLSDAKFLEGQGTVNRINLFLQRDPANGELNDFIQFDKAQTKLFNNDGFSIWTTATQFKKIKETYLDPKEKNLQDLQELNNLIETAVQVSSQSTSPALFGTVSGAKEKVQKEIIFLKYDLQNCCTQVSSQAALEEFMKLVKTKSSQAPILVKLLQDLGRAAEGLASKLVLTH